MLEVMCRVGDMTAVCDIAMSYRRRAIGGRERREKGPLKALEWLDGCRDYPAWGVTPWENESLVAPFGRKPIQPPRQFV